MSKISKEELKQKISEIVADEDVQISLLEDIEDSFIEAEENSVSEEDFKNLEIERDDFKSKYEEIKAKYKERFLSSDNSEEKEPEENEGLEEEKVVDIKEI